MSKPHFSSSCVFVLVMNLFAGIVNAEEPAPAAAEAAPRLSYAIAIHGGAGSMAAGLDEAERKAYEASLAAALRKGRDMLAEGAAALDVVEQVVRMLEDDPLFNAGRGSVFNAAGSHELDASIMDGRDRSCGAVAGVQSVKNPVSLARLVMTQTPHVLLLGDGAEQFAEEMKVERVKQEYFHTDRQFRRWKAAREAADAAAPAKGEKMGTVGCVALDRDGNLAAATSTGGITNKRYGRVGDSPIVGAGTYADNATCAVSCTGTGEHFIRHAVAYDVSARMAYKDQALGEAVRHVVHETLRPNIGGLIAVGRRGEIALDFNTAGMFRGAADASGRFEVAIGRE